MGGDQTGVLLAGLAGFVLGGLIVQAWSRIAQVLISSGAIGGFVGGAIGVVLGKDVTRATALGGGVGVVGGLILVLIDSIVQG